VLPALLRKFAEAASTNAPVTVWGDGSPMREFLYVDDLADALVYLLENVDADRTHGRTGSAASDQARMREVSPDYFVNVGTGTDVTIRELAETIADVVGWKGEIRWDGSKPNGTPRKLMDVSKMTELGWTATTSLRDGIEKTWEWYQSNGPKL
jgi:GDP-L-fucose synthase